MQSELLWFLPAAVVFAVVCYYLGFVRRTLWAKELQAAFLAITCVLLPLALVVLSLQHGARARLSRPGIRPHPGLTKALGLAVGLGDHSAHRLTIVIGESRTDRTVTYQITR